MQIAGGYFTNIALRLRLYTGVFAAVFLLSPPVFSQINPRDSIYTLTDSTRTAGNNMLYGGGDIITTFQGLNFPPEMLMHYEQITPDDAITLIDEFQVTQKDEDGVPILITVKLRFDSDRLVGYIIEAPIDKTIDITVSEFTVKIPVEWICTPATPDHPQHYVSNIAAIKVAEKQYKCKGWHIKLPEKERPLLPNKKSKKDKKSKKGKPAAKPPAH